MILDKMQHAIIIGSILGDGHLQLSPNGQKCRLRFTHGVKQQDYVNWLWKCLKPLCEKTKPPTLITEKGYQMSRCYTEYREELVDYHKLFYKLVFSSAELKNSSAELKKGKYVKIIPANLDTLLTEPLSLLVWYLDDGTLRPDGGACRLATQCFDADEHVILQQCLKKNFGIESSIESWPKNQYGLCIPSRGKHSQRFRELIRPVVEKEIPTMFYKIKTPRND